jgi:hypothetical protein
MIIRKRMLVACAVVVLGLGLFSCVLEPTVDSPNSKAAELPKGMPNGLSVSQPSITFDGATTILAYKVTADFSSGLTYTAQGSTESQSIDALISHYLGKKLLNGNSSVLPGQVYTLNTPPPPYVIIPLDTSLIRDWLEKKLRGNVTERDEDTDIPLVWIEENPVIGGVDALKPTATDNWQTGTYQDTGIRISGIHPSGTTTTYIPSTVENFDDGKDGRIGSIATVLADETDRNKKQRYSSIINFYARDDAEKITGDYALKTPPPTSANDITARADELKTWMKGDKPPVLRVVYEWAD